MAITSNQLEKIYLDVALGRDRTFPGEEYDQYYDEAEKEVKVILDKGGTVRVPPDYVDEESPLEESEYTGDAWDDLDEEDDDLFEDVYNELDDE